MITFERSERSGCEVIDRSEYQETGRLGKAMSEARDRGTRYRHEARHAFSSKAKYHTPTIPKHHKSITSRFHIFAPPPPPPGGGLTAAPPPQVRAARCNTGPGERGQHGARGRPDGRLLGLEEQGSGPARGV